MFNLDQAIAEWRRRMLAAGIKTPVPLEELESHLGEDIEDQMRLGVGAQQAFNAAVERIGRAGLLKREFAKVDVLKQALRRKELWAFIGAGFMSCWLAFGGSPALALAYGVLLAGLIVATFIDFKHFIIPDEITFGGIAAGFFFSLLAPQLQGVKSAPDALRASFWGIVVGAAVLYTLVRVGKLMFGRHTLALKPDSNVVFADTALVLPEKEIPYDELFYRKSDAITLRARTAELAGRFYQDVPIRLTSTNLQIGDDRFNPAAVSRLEAVCAEITVPREAMGLGDVKLMAAIGAFLGWQAVLFSLLVSSTIGAMVGVGLMATRRRERSSQLPYGPCLALAAAIWIFGGKHLLGYFWP